MGRTLPSATQTWMLEEESFNRFRRCLRRQDQLALDDLFAIARKHIAAVAYAAHILPFETMLLAMLIEEHKQVMSLREKMERYLIAIDDRKLIGEENGTEIAESC